MKFERTDIQDVIIIEPDVFGDERGFFMESFNQHKFEEIVGKKVDFVQDNHSLSGKGILRGLHFQYEPRSQGKLIRCISGEIYDVVVDIRKASPTFGKWIGVYLSESNKKQLWIPEGFAHGFITLSNKTEVLYKATDYYSPENEGSIIWNDDSLNIKWPFQPSVISKKDSTAFPFSTLKKKLGVLDE